MAVGLATVSDVAITPDGSELVAAAGGSSTLVSFIVAPDGGALRPGVRGCLAATGSAARCLTLAQIGTDWTRIAMDPGSLRFCISRRLGMPASVTRDFAPASGSVTITTPISS